MPKTCSVYNSAPEQQVTLLPKCTVCFSDCSDRRLKLNGYFSGRDFKYRWGEQWSEWDLTASSTEAVEDLKILKEDDFFLKTRATRSVDKSDLWPWHCTALLHSEGNLYYCWVVHDTLPTLYGFYLGLFFLPAYQTFKHFSLTWRSHNVLPWIPKVCLEMNCND